MPVFTYSVDLRQLSEKDRESIYDYLDRAAETGLYETGTKHLYRCYLDEKELQRAARFVPANVLHQVP